MKRVAFKMKLKPGCETEYKKRHDEIWPEMSRVLREAGVSDYTIFLDPETLVLFAVQKVSADGTTDRLPYDPVVRKWWNFMEDVMETNPDRSPVCVPIIEMFHVD